MVFSSLALLCTLLIAAPFTATAHAMVYTAELKPFGDNSQVTGKVVVFTAHNGITIGYAGSAALLEQDGSDSACAGVNGCGFHIRTGTSCSDTTTLGDLYYGDPILSDIWTNERYTPVESTDSAGFYDGDFQGLLYIGATAIEGLDFVVNGQDGNPVAYGILQSTMDNVLKTVTAPLGDLNVTAELAAITGIRDAGEVCFFGKANGLKRDLVSFKSDPVGADCTAGDGCGLYVHRGESCTNKLMRGGHYYNTPVDPWLTAGYLTTDADGFSLFFDCVLTEEIDFEGSFFSGSS